MTHPLKLFALADSQSLGTDVAALLEHDLAPLEDRSFEDGEHKLRPLESVRGADVYVLQSLHGEAELSVNDKLVRMLFFMGTLRDAGARRITAISPYLCYSRKDQKTKSRDPVSTRFVAQLFEAMGPDCVVSVDVHNIAVFQNAFRCQTEHLEARNLLADAVIPRIGASPIVVMSPDIGGTKRVHRFCEVLSARLGREVQTAYVDKKRSGGQVSGSCTIVGRVQDASVLIVDDMIVSGTTIARAAVACREQGALDVVGLATHGLFGPGSDENLEIANLDHLIVTNSVTPTLAAPTVSSEAVSSEAVSSEFLTIADLALTLASAIKRLHVGGSLVDLVAVR